MFWRDSRLRGNDKRKSSSFARADFANQTKNKIKIIVSKIVNGKNPRLNLIWYAVSAIIVNAAAKSNLRHDRMANKTPKIVINIIIAFLACHSRAGGNLMFS